MPVASALLIVEGPHDADAVARLLKVAGYARVTQKDQLPIDWQKLVNPTFPKPGRQITQPHEVPHFRMRQSGELVAIVIAGGDSKLASALSSSLIPLDQLPEAVGFVLDDDRQPVPAKRFADLMQAIAPEIAAPPFDALAFPAVPGVVHAGPPRTGAFVLPDNQNAGTLEDVLLEAGSVAYGALLGQTQAFVDGLDKSGLNQIDLDAGNKAAGPKKQVVGVAAAILKPGRALATSLQDNRWLEEAALNTPLARGFRGWLHELLDLPTLA